MKLSSVFVLFFFFLYSLRAENTGEIDSLKALLGKAIHDSSRAEIQLLLSGKLAKSESAVSRNYALEALSYYKKIKDERKSASAFSSAAFAFMNSGEYEQAIEYNLRALYIYEKLNAAHPDDSGNKKLLGYIHNKLGAVYYYLGNYNKALEYWHQSLLFSSETNDREGEAYLLNNMGLIYEKQEKFDSALVNHRQSLKIKEALNDRAGISGSMNNIGNIYFYKKEYRKAIEQWKLALRIKEELNEKQGISNTLQNIGFGYYFKKEYDQALTFLNKGLKMAEEINNKHYIKEAYGKLADVYREMKNFEKALEYQQLFGVMKDTIFNEESARRMAEIETRYQTEKKEKEIQIKNLQLSERDAEIKSQRITIFASAGSLMLLLSLAIVILRAYKLKQKANLLLKKQKLEIEIQKGIIEEKNRDITDSIEYAKHIQDAILPEKEKILQALPESFIFYLPKDIVSGDFYWCSQSSTGETLIAAADCTGHGVPGAFMSMIGSNTLTKIVAEQHLTQPAEVLSRLNREIKSALKQKTDGDSSKDGMDIALLKITDGREECRVDFAGANRPLIYFENSELKEVSPDKNAIGGYTNDTYQFTNHRLKFQKDNMLYIFSDGFADQFGGQKGKKFMMKNLKELFKNIKNLPVSEQEKILRDIFLSWKGDMEQVDDVLIIGIRL